MAGGDGQHLKVSERKNGEGRRQLMRHDWGYHPRLVKHFEHKVV